MSVFGCCVTDQSQTPWVKLTGRRRQANKHVRREEDLATLTSFWNYTRTYWRCCWVDRRWQVHRKHPRFHVSLVSCILRFIYPSFHVSFVSCILQSMYPSFHVSFVSYILRSMYSSFHVTFVSCNLRFIYPSVHVSFVPCILRSMYPSFHVTFVSCNIFSCNLRFM